LSLLNIEVVNMDIRTEYNEYKAGRLKIEQLSSACLLEIIKMKNKQIKELTDKVKDLESELARFDKIAKHYDRMKQGLNKGHVKPIKDIDIILDMRSKGMSMEKIAQYLTSLGPEHKATRQTVINRLKRYESSGDYKIDF